MYMYNVVVGAPLHLSEQISLPKMAYACFINKKSQLINKAVLQRT